MVSVVEPLPFDFAQGAQFCSEIFFTTFINFNIIDMPGKTNKSFAKRFRITKNGKVMHRTPHQSHFRAKRSGKVIKRLRGEKAMSKNDVKNITNHMPFN